MPRLQSGSANLNPSSLFATFEYRFKASELSESIDLEAAPASCFPPNIAEQHKVTIGGTGGAANATARGGRGGAFKATRGKAGGDLPVVVQLVDIWDIGSSRVDTLERIEMAERGEVRKGHEVIRVPPEGSDEQGRAMSGGGVSSPKSIGPHKLLLEDA